MPIETIEFKGEKYPKWQSEGNAARWIMPLAMYHCKGDGFDIGCMKPEWAFPGALMIDPVINPAYNAMNLPSGEWDNADYIFSSHCLEHVKENWMNVLDYWMDKLRDGGVLFLYLPHKSQTYWLPENNRKHVHSFDGIEISYYLHSKGYDPYLTPVDYNNSFAVICYKEVKEQTASPKKIAGWVSISDELLSDINEIPFFLHTHKPYVKWKKVDKFIRKQIKKLNK